MKTEKRIRAGRRIAGDVLLALSAMLTADVLTVMLHKINTVVLKEKYQEMLFYELIPCAALLLLSLDMRFDLFTRSKHRLLRIAGRIPRAALSLFCLVILFFSWKVVIGSLINTSAEADNAIVLGLALENGQPAEDLISRLDTAQKYLEQYPDSHLVLTGGNADASGRSEADVMHDILAARGVPEDRMIIEDRAESTRANFRNVLRFVDPEEPVVLISSNYHMDRTVSTAKSAGFKNILRLPAPSGAFGFGADVISEVVLEINELTFQKE